MRRIAIALFVMFAACGEEIVYVPVPAESVIVPSEDLGHAQQDLAPHAVDALEQDLRMAPTIAADMADLPSNACRLGDAGTSGTLCGSTCTDTNTDPNNCAACGNVCANGPCVNAVCKIAQGNLCNPSNDQCAPGFHCYVPMCPGCGMPACENF